MPVTLLCSCETKSLFTRVTLAEILDLKGNANITFLKSLSNAVKLWNLLQYILVKLLHSCETKSLFTRVSEGYVSLTKLRESATKHLC